MVNIYLPGNSIRNLNFTEKFAKKLTKKFNWNVYARRWNHWFNNSNEDEEKSQDINFELEVSQTVKILKNFKKNFGIVAKSIGILVGLESIIISGYTPKYLILMGLPLKESNSDSFEMVINSLFMQLEKDNPPDIYLIANDEDPVSNIEVNEYLFNRLKEKASKLNIETQLELIIKKEKSHTYEYFEDLVILLERYNQ